MAFPVFKLNQLDYSFIHLILTQSLPNREFLAPWIIRGSRLTTKLVGITKNSGGVHRRENFHVIPGPHMFAQAPSQGPANFCTFL
jgi:hypothetical protein